MTLRWGQGIPLPKATTTLIHSGVAVPLPPITALLSCPSLTPTPGVSSKRCISQHLLGTQLCSWLKWVMSTGAQISTWTALLSEAVASSLSTSVTPLVNVTHDTVVIVTQP